MTVKVFAPAKINLSLHVVGQREDGYHLLDSLVAFAPVGDQLSIIDADVSSLSVHGPESAGVPTDWTNLALRAAEIIAPDRPVAIDMIKNLPVASGIGGGSTDAAAAVRGLSFATNRDAAESGTSDFQTTSLTLNEKLLSLGADVPMCLVPRPQRAQGIGDILTPIEIPELPTILVNPRVQVSTKEIFASLRNKNNAPMPDVLPAFAGVLDFCEWLSDQRNDLEHVAKVLCPEIDQVLKVLANLNGVLLTRMSGSGATCFAIFETSETAQDAQRKIAADHPNFWVTEGVLGNCVEKAAPRSS